MSQWAKRREFARLLLSRLSYEDLYGRKIQITFFHALLVFSTRVLCNRAFFFSRRSSTTSRKRKREGEGDYLCWINTSRIRIALLKQKKTKNENNASKTLPFALLLSLIDSAARFISQRFMALRYIGEKYISPSRRKQTVWRLICRDTKASFSQNKRRCFLNADCLLSASIDSRLLFV